MTPILVLWAVPRSTSTAFEWMMRMRGDHTCFHEPFGEPWYHGEQPLWPRAGDDTKRTPGLTMDSVWDELCSAAEQGPVFSKDFAHYVRHLWDDKFLSCFNHSFLVRDPAKMLTSMYRQWPDFLLEETGIAEQRELFDRLCERDGRAPPLIDSDDLLEDPHGMVEAWCNAVGIPFMAGALSWEPGKRDEVSWYDGGSWHASLRDSDGLKPQPRRAIDINAAPDRVRRIYDACLPHYQHMHALRLVHAAAESV